MEEFSHRGIKIQRHGRRWRWRARDAHRTVVRSAATLEAAQELLDDFLDARANRDASRRALPEVQIGQLCADWLQYKSARIAPATVQQYGIHIRVHIGPAIGSADANAIRPMDLEQFYSSLRWKPAKESHNILRQSFDWGLRNGILVRESNPCRTIRPSRRTSTDDDGFFDVSERMQPRQEKDVPKPIEVEKLLVDAHTEGREAWWLYLKLASTLGARPGEICALRARDIDFEKHTIRIEWSADRISGRIKRPKTPSGVRTLHLPASFFEEIAPLIPDDPDAFLFPSNTQPGATSPLPCWNSRGVKRRLDAALQRTGLPHYTPHSFRHFVATHLLDQGWPPLQVARFLGHANDSLVRTLYANHIVDETQRQIGEAAAGLV